MALGKTLTRLSVVVMSGAVIGACGGDDDDTAALPAPDSGAAATGTMVPPPPITDTTAAATPGVTAAPGVTPGAAPTTTPGATPSAPVPAGPAAKGAAPAGGGGGGNAAEGQQLYAGGVCVACHGPAGAGTALAPALNDNQWLWFTTRPTQDQLVTLIKAGVPQPKSHPAPMPPMGGAALTDPQVRSIAAYILSISG
jgi:mono/diheme cytochrome c family protein